MGPPSPAGRDRLDTIEAFRGLAALLVLLYHAGDFVTVYFGHQPLWGAVSWGFAGIDFFFVLSGFIILWVNRPLAGLPQMAGSYLWKRFLRIYPLYWMLTLPIVAAYFVLPIARQGWETETTAILGSLTLVPVHSFPHLPVAWTLTQEMLFYGLFATVILNRRLGILVLAAWQGATLANLFLDDTAPLAKIILNPRNLHFGLGMLVALAVSAGRVPASGRSVALAGLALAGLGLAWVALDARPTPPWWFAFAAATACLIGTAAAWERQAPRRVPKPLLLLGASSYALYLLHYPLELVVIRGFKAAASWVAPPPWLLFWIAVGLAVAGGIALHLLVERPLLRVLRGQRAASAPAGGMTPA